MKALLFGCCWWLCVAGFAQDSVQMATHKTAAIITNSAKPKPIAAAKNSWQNAGVNDSNNTGGGR